jgi:hypothetical protein
MLPSKGDNQEIASSKMETRTQVFSHSDLEDSKLTQGNAPSKEQTKIAGKTIFVSINSFFRDIFSVLVNFVLSFLLFCKEEVSSERLAWCSYSSNLINIADLATNQTYAQFDGVQLKNKKGNA